MLRRADSTSHVAEDKTAPPFERSALAARLKAQERAQATEPKPWLDFSKISATLTPATREYFTRRWSEDDDDRSS